MKRSWQPVAAVIGALVGVLAIILAVALLVWPELSQMSAPQQPAAAMKECMTTCTTWHLVGSLYHRGLCRPCEDLPECAGTRDAPSHSCMDALRACYHAKECVGAMLIACDKRCSGFIDNLQRGSSGARW